MSKADVKAQLAAKYFRSAKNTSSKPRQKNYLHKAEKYRREAAILRGQES